MSEPTSNRVRTCALVFAALLRGAGSSSAPSNEKASSRAFGKAVHSAMSNFKASQSNKEKGITVSRVPATVDVSPFHAPKVELHGVEARLREIKQDATSTKSHLDPDAVEVVFQPDQIRAAVDSRNNKNGESRRLQTCAAGSGVTVTSTFYPLMEGCLVEAEVYAGAEVDYTSDYGVIVASDFIEDDLTVYWGALYRETTSTDIYDVVCLSIEAAMAVHPSTATWRCLNEDGTIVVVVDPEFVVDCGCDGVNPGTSPVTPSPATGDSSPTALLTSSSGTCADEESFTVTTVLPGADGCYFAHPVDVVNDMEFYTQSGTADGGDVWVYALPLTAAASSTVHWFISFVPTETSSTSFSSSQFCFSLEEASTVHPAEVGTWYCNFASTSTDMATAGELSIECGCSTDTDSPLTSAPETPGPTPAATLGSVTTTAPAGSFPTMAPTPAQARDIALSPSPTVASTRSPTVALTSPPSVAPTTSPTVAPTPSLNADPTPQPTSSSTTPRGVVSTSPPVGAPSPASSVASTVPPTVAFTPALSAAPIRSPTVENETGTISPISTPDPTLSPGAGSAPTACGSTESIQVTSGDLSEIEGCFQEVELSTLNSDTFSEVWAVSGSLDIEQVIIFSAVDDGTGEEGATYPYFVGFLSANDDQNVLYCYSLEEAVTFHPTDATWACDMDGSGSYAPVTDAEVAMSCGCTSLPPVDDASTSGGAVSRSLPSWPVVAFVTCLMVIARAQRRGS